MKPDNIPEWAKKLTEEVMDSYLKTDMTVDDAIFVAVFNTIHEARSALEAQQVRIEELEKDNERLAGAWHALHERMVKDNESHARYFEKSQART